LLSEANGPEDAAAFSGTSVPNCSTASSKVCVPMAPVSINVIGEDGYWTLSSVLPTAKAYLLPPLPNRTMIGAVLIGVFIMAHLVVLYLIRRELRKDAKTRPFLELPFVRVLAPPQTVQAVAGYHRFALTMCFVLLALLAAWAAAITLPFLPASFGELQVACLSALIFGAIVVLAVKLYGPSIPSVDAKPTETKDSVRDDPPAARTSANISSFTGWLFFVGMIATMVLFATVTMLLIAGSTDSRVGSMTLARMVGGGILSPAALTVSLIAAIYTVVI